MLSASWSCLGESHCTHSQAVFLQANAVTNAGFGSNLTLEGRVEADASIMLGEGTFGAVGAIPGLQCTAQTPAILSCKVAA